MTFTEKEFVDISSKIFIASLEVLKTMTPEQRLKGGKLKFFWDEWWRKHRKNTKDCMMELLKLEK